VRIRGAGIGIEPDKFIRGKVWGLKATPGESLAYSPRNTGELVVIDFSKLAFAGNYKTQEYQFKVSDAPYPTLFNTTNQTLNFTHISISERGISQKIQPHQNPLLTIQTGTQTKATVCVLAEVNNTRTFFMFLRNDNFTLVTVITDRVLDFALDKSPEAPHWWDAPADLEQLLDPANSERFVTVFATQEKKKKVYLRRIISQFDGERLIK
jgi:hypothetical protein